jgi:hypothetical protein
MTEHACTTFDPKCWRCELGRDETLAQKGDPRAHPEVGCRRRASNTTE